MENLQQQQAMSLSSDDLTSHSHELDHEQRHATQQHLEPRKRRRHSISSASNSNLFMPNAISFSSNSKQGHRREASSRLHPMRDSASGQRFTLDVGGTIFSTHRSTLTSIPDTFFSSLISQQWSNTAGSSNCNSAFIDRDACLFRHILNYLRDLELPSNLSDLELESLEQEAAFYSVSPLLELIKQRRRERSLISEANEAQLQHAMQRCPHCSHCQQALKMRSSSDANIKFFSMTSMVSPSTSASFAVAGTSSLQQSYANVETQPHAAQRSNSSITLSSSSASATHRPQAQTSTGDAWSFSEAF